VCSYDYVLLDFPDWTDEHQRQADALQKETGILTDTTERRSVEDEFPEPR
jgi:hypothetical protein